MAASGSQTIQLYYSTSSGTAPVAGNLASGELAINITDGKLYYKDNSGVVQTLATNAATSGSFSDITVSGNATLSGGTANGVLYLNGSKVATSGSALTFDGSSMVLDTSTSSTALRITQTGTGNALLVEDSANPDSTPLVVNNIGQLVVGHTAAIGAGQNTNIQSQSTGTLAGVSAFRWSNDATPPRLQVGKSRSTTIGSYTIVQDGDQLGGVYFYGDDGTDLVSQGASIIAEVDGTPGVDDMPGRLSFRTTADGASVPTERLRIDSAGTSTFTGQAIINASGTSDGLRITQTGTGNALLVEDSTNPDSTPLVIDASGRVIQGYTTAILTADDYNGTTRTGWGYQAQSTASANALFLNWSTTATSGGSVSLGRSRSTTIGTPAVVLSGDSLGGIGFVGDDGTNFIVGASISSAVDGTPGTNDMPGRLVFSTTADGDSSPTERMRIDSAGVQRQFGSLSVQNTLGNDVTYNFSFDVSTQEAGASSIAFRPDGKMMYVLGTGSDDITYYSLSTAWDITTATHVGQSNSTSTQNSAPQGMFFKPDGTKVFIVGTTAPAGVWAYSCAAPWDVSTLTYDSVTYDLSAITTAPLGIWFKPDGTKMYITSNTGGTATYTDTILEYSLSTAWLVSSATLTTYFSVASQDTAPAGVQFTEDGFRMFVCGQNGDTVVVYDLSTAWNINTATFKYETSNLSTLVGTAITPTDIFIQPNGQTLYVLSDTGSGAGTNMVYQFTVLKPVTIDLVGNTTISGNATVNQDLTVRGATNLQTNPTLSSGTANGVLYLNGSKVATSGSALTFDGAGVFSVVDTSSPRLSVNGSSTASGYLIFKNTTSNTNVAYVGYEFANSAMPFAVGGSEQMRLTSTGLGIGTSSPSYKLDVDSTAATVVSLNSTNASGPGLRFTRSGTANGYVGSAKYIVGGALADFGIDVSGANNLIFGTNDVERARLDSSGNFGIAVTSPAAKLDVLGDIFARASTLRFKDSGNTTQYGAIYGDATSFHVNAGVNNLIFYSAGTERARIDSSGNLLVGTTSTTVWNGSAGTKVVVGGSGNTITSLQSSTTTVDQGAIFEGYATGISSNSAALGSIAFLRSNTSTTALSSYTAFYTNNAGTVAERARITSGGDLLVGTTSSAANSGTGVKLLPSGYVYVVAPSTTSDTYNYYNSTAGAYRFYVTNAGVINATSTTITAISDQRLKENIQDIDVGLDAVMALKPRKFDWKAGKGKDKKGDRGWIAQEFEQVFPDMITTWKDEPPEGEEPYKAVNADLIPVLVKAIQELKAEFDAYKATHP